MHHRLVCDFKCNTFSSPAITIVPRLHQGSRQPGFLEELTHLLGVVSLQAELAGHFAAGKLAAVEVHTPGATEGKRRSASVLVQTLTRTRSTGGRWEEEGSVRNGSRKASRMKKKRGKKRLTLRSGRSGGWWESRI